MAKNKGDKDEATAKRSKMKAIIPVVLLLAGLVAGKTFFGGKTEKSAAAVAAEKKEAEAALYEQCAEANGVETDGDSATPNGDEGGSEGLPSILEMESVTVNLADEHYLKLGLALQLKGGVTAEAADKEGLGARALDMALERVSAKRMKDLLPSEARAQLKRDLGLDVCLAYKGEVTTVYFTEFVMQ